MTEQEMLLLNLANGALGVATVIPVLMIAWATFSELAERVRARRAVTADAHAFSIAGLGVTMADGGEKVDGKEPKES